MRFLKTEDGWKPADEGEWRRQSIEWNLGCLGRLTGICAALGGIAAVGVGAWQHVNPLVLAGAFLFHYWDRVLAGAGLLFVVGIMWDFLNSLERETSFQEALIDTLNTINARLEMIEETLKDREAK